MNLISLLRTLLLAIGLSMAPVILAEVPIDSPRGNYEGADNIHWYQQSSLKKEDYEQDIPGWTEKYRCNNGNIGKSCQGRQMTYTLEMYDAQGTAPFNIAIWVDDRVTPGFDFPWRRAIREVRRINAALERSGVKTRAYIAALEFKNLSQFGGDPTDIWEHYSSNEKSVVAYARKHEADAVMIIRNAEGIDNSDYCGSASLGPAWYWLPIIVLNCVYEEAEQSLIGTDLIAAHEFGHVLGLDHDADANGPETLLPHAYGYHDATNFTRTIMSQKEPALPIPIFSSPQAVWGGVTQGDEDDADATSALNDVAVTAALFYELKWGRLAGNSVSAAGVNSTAAAPLPPVMRH